MKIWKKINKGLLLTIIVLAVLIVYLIGVENQRKEDKVDIKKAVEEFVSFTDKYAVLPKEMQTLEGEIAKTNEENLQKEIKEELEKLMISNSEAVEIQYEHVLNTLKNGYSKNQVKTENKREITKISSYEFDKNQVKVTFRSKVNTTYQYIDELSGEKQERKNSFDSSVDEISLQKIDGKWKIIYSNLMNDNNEIYMDTRMY